MAEASKIEWTDHTFNPWIGCQKVSPACDNCYAEALMDIRYGQVEWGPGKDRKRTGAQNWNKPRKWNREADAFEAEHGRPQFVFCASLADVFDNAVPGEWREDLWNLIRETPRLVWLLLTKRPQNIAKMLPDDWGDGWPNVWLGATVEDQKRADQNIPFLLSVPAARRFLSCEPLLGPISLTNLDTMHFRGAEDIDCLGGLAKDWCGQTVGRVPSIHWVICGGESGAGARPMHPDWARSLRDQCAGADVPFFFKQWGDWLPWEFHVPPDLKGQNGAWMDRNWLPDLNDAKVMERWGDAHLGDFDGIYERVGKVRAGRMLDGRTWDDRPTLTDNLLTGE